MHFDGRQNGAGIKGQFAQGPQIKGPLNER
jgi:hypothetical protein